jgi:hypothetical protein
MDGKSHTTHRRFGVPRGSEWIRLLLGLIGLPILLLLGFLVWGSWGYNLDSNPNTTAPFGFAAVAIFGFLFARWWVVPYAGSFEYIYDAIKYAGSDAHVIYTYNRIARGTVDGGRRSPRASPPSSVESSHCEFLDRGEIAASRPKQRFPRARSRDLNVLPPREALARFAVAHSLSSRPYASRSRRSSSAFCAPARSAEAAPRI